MSDEVVLAIDDLQAALRKQKNASDELKGAVVALTDMMAHLIDSNRALCERLDKLEK